MYTAGQKAGATDPGRVAPLEPEVSDALWEGASLIAVDSTDNDGPIPVEPRQVAGTIATQLGEPTAEAASQDQVLSDELLANDSLGG